MQRLPSEAAKDEKKSFLSVIYKGLITPLSSQSFHSDSMDYLEMQITKKKSWFVMKNLNTKHIKPEFFHTRLVLNEFNKINDFNDICCKSNK